MRIMKIMNCCTIDCTQDNLDRREREGYSSADLLKMYHEDLPTDGVTPLISPSSCDYYLDSEFAHASSNSNLHKHKQHSYENLNVQDSLIGPVATSHDESGELKMARAENANQRRVSHLPRYKANKTAGDTNESGGTLRSILTGRELRRNVLSVNPDGPYHASDVCHEYHAKFNSGLPVRKDWWKGA